MPTPITPDLDELKRLYEAAKGPDGDHDDWKVQGSTDKSAFVYCAAFPRDLWIETSGLQRVELADFIVAAHNSFPALLAAAEERDRLAGEVAALRERVVELGAENGRLKRRAGVWGQSVQPTHGHCKFKPGDRVAVKSEPGYTGEVIIVEPYSRKGPLYWIDSSPGAMGLSRAVNVLNNVRYPPGIGMHLDVVPEHDLEPCDDTITKGPR
jgi:hypothetical protein